MNIEYSNSLQNEVALDTITESESVKENNITPEKFIDRKDVAQSSNIQIDFTMLEKEALLNTIKDLDVMLMTPLDAMNTLFKIVQDAKKIM